MNNEPRTTRAPRLRPLAAALLACCAGGAHAQTVAQALPEISVQGRLTPPQKIQTPASSEGVSAAQIADTVNMVNLSLIHI